MTRHEAVTFAAALALLLSAGCSSDSGAQLPLTSTGGGGGSGGGTSTGGTNGEGTGGVEVNVCESAATDDEGNLLLKVSAASNYAFSSALSLQPIPVASRTELFFDWSGVTKDFINHAVNPLADIDMITLIVWNLTQTEFETKLNDDALVQNDFEALVTLYTQKAITSGSLFDFTSFGTELSNDTLLGAVDASALDPATHFYTMMAVTGTTAGEGTRMIQGFVVDPNSANTQVTMDGESTQLAYSVDLHSSQPLGIPAGEAAIAVEWTDMTINAMGREFVPTFIEEVQVARYSLTPAQLEEQFLDLDLIADEMWTAEVPSGTSIVLSDLTNEAGQAFGGIDDTHTWIVALICGRCMNPAPWYISILEPCVAE
jgi:hypothetical protein